MGDALGAPTEFIPSVAAIRERFGAEGLRDFAPFQHHAAGSFTDDTQMTVAVLRALVRGGPDGLEAFMRALGEECVAWAKHPDNDRAPGRACLEGCARFERHGLWRESGLKDSKGCGAAMRAAPVGLFCADDAQLVRWAAAQAALTHAHPTGIASSVAAAAAVAHAARGGAPLGLLDAVERAVRTCDAALLVEVGADEALARQLGASEMLAALERTRQAVERESEDVCDLLGPAWIGEEAVACALWCVLRAGGSFEEAVLRGANSSGDSDSIACIAGAIAGTLGGASEVERRFAPRLERRHELDVLARYLHWVRHTGRSVPSLPGPLDFFEVEARRPQAVASKAPPRGEEPAAPSVKPSSSAPRPSPRPPSSPARSLPLPREGALGEAPVRAVRHARPFSVPACCESPDALERWLARLGTEPLVAHPSIEGVACVLRYDALGLLVLAATRGDGRTGEDVTASALAVRGVPARVTRGPCEIVGVVHARASALGAAPREARSSPALLAAAALRDLSEQRAPAHELSFAAVDLVGLDLSSQSERLRALRHLGFAPPPAEVGPPGQALALVEALARRSAELDAPVRGTTFVVDAVAPRAALEAVAGAAGWTMDYAPGAARVRTTLRAVEWSVTRAGIITPVAFVDPVLVDRTTVTRASLGYAARVSELGLTLDARVLLLPRGGAIPELEAVEAAGAVPVPVPTRCPACGGRVTALGDVLCCADPEDCRPARVERIVHWVSATELKGLGPALVERAVASELVREPADLYRLDASRLLQLGVPERSVPRLLLELDRARVVDLEAFLRGLGIDGLHRPVAGLLASTFGRLDTLRAATPEALARVDQVGPRLARAIADGLARRAGVIDGLLLEVKLKPVEIAAAGAS